MFVVGGSDIRGVRKCRPARRKAETLGLNVGFRKRAGLYLPLQIGIITIPRYFYKLSINQQSVLFYKANFSCITWQSNLRVLSFRYTICTH